jgi:hypothetical protein
MFIEEMYASVIRPRWGRMEIQYLFSINIMMSSTSKPSYIIYFMFLSRDDALDISHRKVSSPAGLGERGVIVSVSSASLYLRLIKCRPLRDFLHMRPFEMHPFFLLRVHFLWEKYAVSIPWIPYGDLFLWRSCFLLIWMPCGQLNESDRFCFPVRGYISIENATPLPTCCPQDIYPGRPVQREIPPASSFFFGSITNHVGSIGWKPKFS